MRGKLRMYQRMKWIVLCTALAAPLPAFANPEEAVLDATLLPGWSTESGGRMAAFSVTLAPGWKTYWRSPGDAGIPPLFDWSASENLASVRYHWPTPEVFHTAGYLSLGYHDGIMLPVEVTAVDPDLPVVLRATVDMGVCKDICLPASVTVDTVLTAPGANNPAIKAALRAQPQTAAAAGLGQISCAVDATEDGLRLTATIDLPVQGGEETVVFESGVADIWASTATTTRTGNVLTTAADLVAPSGAPFTLDRSGVILTVIGDGQAVEIRGCPAG
jgi:DsbC/DsbD-like thiol-disulfide interchange protein